MKVNEMFGPAVQYFKTQHISYLQTEITDHYIKSMNSPLNQVVSLLVIKYEHVKQEDIKHKNPAHFRV